MSLSHRELRYRGLCCRRREWVPRQGHFGLRRTQWVAGHCGTRGPCRDHTPRSLLASGSLFTSPTLPRFTLQQLGPAPYPCQMGRIWCWFYVPPPSSASVCATSRPGRSHVTEEPDFKRGPPVLYPKHRAPSRARSPVCAHPWARGHRLTPLCPTLCPSGRIWNQFCLHPPNLY